MKIHKYYTSIRLSEEEVFMYRSWRDDRFARKVANKIKHDPTPEQFAEHERVKAAWEIVSNSGYFIAGCSCADPIINEPEPRIEYVYAETEQEWRDRCRGLIEAESPLPPAIDITAQILDNGDIEFLDKENNK